MFSLTTMVMRYHSSAMWSKLTRTVVFVAVGMKSSKYGLSAGQSGVFLRGF